MGALYGPLHGGANEAVLKMLARIGNKAWGAPHTSPHAHLNFNRSVPKNCPLSLLNFSRSVPKN